MTLWKRLAAWSRPGDLRAKGIVGINSRNADFILLQNPRRLYPRADDKLITKGIAEERGIPIPRTYAVIERFGDIVKLPALAADHQEFVIKPTRGAAGRGIVVVARHADGIFESPSGSKTPLADLRAHISTILSGLYSLGGLPDKVIMEQRLVRHPELDPIVYGGTPDIRIIVYRNVPVMAMIRLPTQSSRGRANLHQGAIAAGLDLATGRTHGGVCLGKSVSIHPDTKVSIEGFQIPRWDDLIGAAMSLAEGIGMGYVGVDLVIDAELGPVVLEANARPGLAIQVANRCGLRHRLDRVDEALSGGAEGFDRGALIRDLSTVR